ncbi:MAG: CCA tRNA nucleotidyltransferase [Acidobacteriota bacterium]|nr:CCA tRNA nucleotidyltransferase [Acidobacteriota bacterium]
MHRRAALEAIRVLRARGYQALWAGGCVRDLLLGREPADYDVATSATPRQVMSVFAETYAVGAQFGVVLVPLKVLGQPQAEGHIEVATFRSDGAYADGRHPDSVTYSTSAQHDVERRDFTINGMLLDPLSANPNTPHGELFDYVGGVADLHRGLVRTIGRPERRFTEDKLRMMRAVRFAARFHYAIDPATMTAIRGLAAQIDRVSAERQRDELCKMLLEGSARRAFTLLSTSGLLRQVLPEMDAMRGVEQPPQFHPEGDVFAHTLLLLDKLPSRPSLTLAWGALLHDVGKPATFRRAPDRIRFDGHVEIGVRVAEEVLTRLRFSSRQREQIVSLVANHMRFADVRHMKDSTFKRFIRLDNFEEHLELHRLDCLASHGKLDLYDYTRDRMSAVPEEEVHPEPLLNGRELIAAGFRPGPQFAEILTAVEDAQLDGEIGTRPEALAFAKRIFPR